MMTFLEGLLSFLSPCVLPMVPVYLIYLAGDRQRPLLNSVFFVLGFSSVLIALGVFAGSLGAALAAHRQFVRLVCSGLLIVFGLMMVFDWHLPFGLAARQVRVGGILSAFLFGMAFPLYMMPCAGAFLGSALVTAASEGGALTGALLLGEYALGLAIPLLLCALMIGRLKTMLNKINVHARKLAIVAGLLLIGFGCWTGASSASNRAPQTISKNENEKTDKKESVMEITLSAANFEAEVIKSDKPVIVDFWAPWCGPCRMLAPELEALAAEKGDAIKVGKVNVDENAELCAKYGIMSIPAIFVFKNGQITAQSVGYQKKAELAALLTK